MQTHKAHSHFAQLLASTAGWEEELTPYDEAFIDRQIEEYEKQQEKTNKEHDEDNQ